MTKDEHRELHIRLHKALDQLVTDYLAHQLGERGADFKGTTETTLQEFMHWSCEQTKEPTDPPARRPGEKPLP